MCTCDWCGDLIDEHYQYGPIEVNGFEFCSWYCTDEYNSLDDPTSEAE